MKDFHNELPFSPTFHCSFAGFCPAFDLTKSFSVDVLKHLTLISSQKCAGFVIRRCKWSWEMLHLCCLITTTEFFHLGLTHPEFFLPPKIPPRPSCIIFFLSIVSLLQTFLRYITHNWWESIYNLSVGRDQKKISAHNKTLWGYAVSNCTSWTPKLGSEIFHWTGQYHGGLGG